MRKPAIRAIFVDFGNVCVPFDFHRFIKNFSKAANVSGAKLRETLIKKGADGGYSPLFEAIECGEITPVGFFHVLTTALGCTERIDYTTFARLWIDIFDKENTGLDKLLSELPQKKYLLSNTNTIVHGRYIADCTIVRNHFPSRAERILSYEVGVVKPNPLIYKVALARARVNPNEALFLDDMPENIEAWRKLGGHGIVYNVQTDSIEKLKEELVLLGILK